VPTELHWGTLLLSQAEDRAPLESDPSADLEAGMRWEGSFPPFPSQLANIPARKR